MPDSWQHYEFDVAQLFRSRGFQVEGNASVEGVRGIHKVDVWVTGKIGELAFRWVVECKDWKANIPKEKVLALQAIVQDVGADKGFLFSEKGFQAGAIRCAHKTNL